MQSKKEFNPKEHFTNKLIVVEGPDFSTKTTFIKMLSEYLTEIGVDHIKTFQPGDTAYGEEAKLIRELTKKEDMSEQSSLFLYLYDRIQNNKKIVRPALEEGKTVISDRWWYSTMAYQWSLPYIRRHFSWEEMEKMNRFASTWLEPDLGVLLFRENFDPSNLFRDEVDKYDKATPERRRDVNAVYSRFFMEGKLKKVLVMENDKESTFKLFLKMEERNEVATRPSLLHSE